MRRQLLRSCLVRTAINFRSITNNYKEKYEWSVKDPEGFWREQGKQYLTWNTPFNKAMDCDLQQGHITFFDGGFLNASENCIDRHLPKRAKQVALIWEKDEAGDVVKVTYEELYKEVCRLANVLKRHGVQKGDVVTIYLPMCLHAVYAMLACSRIGAVHSVVFAGFSAEALSSRMKDSNSAVLITANQGLRGGRKISLKKTVDEALGTLPSHQVRSVLVYHRTSESVHMKEGRDYDLAEAMLKERPFCPPVAMASEDLLFLLYTSGSTGKPKGLEHTTAGYLTYAALTHKEVFDVRDGDVFGCMADIGWITGHSYIVYGPLVNGSTTVVFESVPTYPNPGRYWDMVQRLKMTQIYTAPTALRLLMTSGDQFVKAYDRSSLRVLGSVGEPINPEAWKWYNDVVGDGKCSVVDTWWQTETGGHMITPLATDKDQKPGYAMRPFYGVVPVLLDEKGNELLGNNVKGNLCIKQAIPGMARSVFADYKRFIETYWSTYPGYYFTGDGALRDEDGHIRITGRVDDVLNVSGHRIGTSELETSLTNNDYAAEAAVVGYPHEIKGEGIYAYVIIREGVPDSKKVIDALKANIRKEIGNWAVPDAIEIVHDLPKTRSGKIMRRVLRKISCSQYDDIGDISSCANPAIIEDLIKNHERLKKFSSIG